MAVEILRPNATGDYTGLMAYNGSLNWENVKEEIPDGMSTFNQIAFSTGYDLYGLPNHTAGNGTINSVKVYFCCQVYMGQVNAWAKAVIKTHGIEYRSDAKSVPGSWQTHDHTWVQNPYEEANWTWDEIDALQAGVELHGEEYVPVSVIEGSIIALSDGSHKRIEDIKIGELICSYDLDKGYCVANRVTGVISGLGLYLIFNNSLRATYDHPIFCNGAFKKAIEIKIGDMLKDEDGKDVSVISITKQKELANSYNLALSSKPHNFFADGYLVHNECHCTQLYVEVDYTPLGGYYHGLKVQGVGELALCDAGNNPLRIRKGGVTYGIELVDVSDPNASRLRIKTPAGIKAIRKYT